jgi:hypothetical protein
MVEQTMGECPRRSRRARADLIAVAALAAAALTGLAFRGSFRERAAQSLLVLAKPVSSTQSVPGDKAARPAAAEKNKPGTPGRRIAEDEPAFWSDVEIYNKARPYADLAAQSWAGWAMISAARCAEEMADWEAAERWIEKIFASMPASSRPNSCVFAGVFLDRHGKPDVALDYLKRANAEQCLPWFRLIALDALRARKIDPGSVPW